MKILIFLDTDHISGPARLALDFAVEAGRQGHEVLMLGLVRGRTPTETDFSRELSGAGLNVAMLHERRRFDPAVADQFARILADFNPDVYQSHGYKGSWLGLRAKKRGVPWQAIFHGFTWENWKVRLYHWLDVRWLRRADEVISVSRAFADELSRRGVGRDRVHWVPNAISEEALRATDSGADLRGDWFAGRRDIAVMGVLGRFSPEKGPDVFVRAFGRAMRQAPQLRAVMVGDGPLLERCRAEGNILGDGMIVFPGFRRDLAAIYRAIDALVIPSRSEGMPTVMIEAMLLGVPVISTRVGAVPDVLDDGRTGLLAEIEDEEGLAAAMVRLGNDADLRGRMAEAAGLLARERLTVEERTRDLLERMERLHRS